MSETSSQNRKLEASLIEQGPPPSVNENPLPGAPDASPEQPEWLAAYHAEQKTKAASKTVTIGRGNVKWQKGMPSPNPKGRPPGIAERKAKVHERMLDEAAAIMDVMIEKALEGDAAAATLVVSRVLPVLRPQSEKVNFVLNADGTISAQVEQVLAAVSKGEIAPDVGKKIIEAIQSLGNVRAIEELESRLAKLEEKAR